MKNIGIDVKNKRVFVRKSG